MIRKPCQSDAGVQALLDPPVKPEDDGGGVALIGVPNDSRASKCRPPCKLALTARPGGKIVACHESPPALADRLFGLPA